MSSGHEGTGFSFSSPPLSTLILGALPVAWPPGKARGSKLTSCIVTLHCHSSLSWAAALGAGSGSGVVFALAGLLHEWLSLVFFFKYNYAFMDFNIFVFHFMNIILVLIFTSPHLWEGTLTNILLLSYEERL